MRDAAILCVLLAAPALAQAPAPSAVVETSTGTRLEGRLGPGSVLVATAFGDVELPLERVTRVRWGSPKEARLREVTTVVGDRLIGYVRGSGVTLATALGEVEVPWARVDLLEVAGTALAAEDASTIVLATGDHVNGRVAEPGWALETGIGRVGLPLAGAGLVFKGPDEVTVTPRDGPRRSGRLVGPEELEVVLAVAEVSVRLPRGLLASITPPPEGDTSDATDRFEAGLDGWSHDGAPGYQLALEGGAARLRGDDFAKSAWMQKRFVAPGVPVVLSLRWRATSNSHQAGVTNARLEVRDLAGKLLLEESLAGQAARDTGWCVFDRDLTPLLQGQRSFVVRLGLVDSWSTNWGQAAWFDDVRVRSGPAKD